MWLQAVHPRAEVVVVDDLCAWHHPDPCLHACTDVWVARIGQLGLGKIDVVGTSESYGDRFSTLLGAEHLSVDSKRTLIPVSSSEIRRDLKLYWSQLHRVVKTGLTRRVVILGAESTGTSTLARDLASKLGVADTAEAGRTVSWELFARSESDMSKIEWTEGVFWDIVNKQIALEHHAISESIQSIPGRFGPWVVCDTDTLATVAWWERYLHADSTSILQFASSRFADLYLLTDPTDVIFDDSDPLRDGALIRSSMHSRMMQLLEQSGRPWRLMTGSPSDRLAAAMEAIRGYETSNPRWVHH